MNFEEAPFWSRIGQLVAGRRGRYVTLGVWVVVVAILTMLFPNVSKYENNNAQNFPQSAWSNQASSVIAKEFPNTKGTPALLVFYRAGGLTTADAAHIQQLSQSLENKPVVTGEKVVPYNKMPVQVVEQMRSSDKTTFIMPIILPNSVQQTQLNADVTALQSRVTNVFHSNPFHNPSITSSGLHARVTGPVGIAVDTLNLFKGADIALLIATVFLVLILLFVLYRSPILALIPLVGVGFAYGAIGPILGIFAKHGVITVDAQTISIMTVLLFGAGTDYCLFLINRYREALLEEQDARGAMKRALQGAGGAIAMSGITVVVSLLTLLLAKYGSEHRFAIPFALSILVMFINAVTFIPALLAILRRGAFFPFIPRTVAMEEARAARKGKPLSARVVRRGSEDGFGLRLGKSITKHPWTYTLTSFVILAVFAFFSTQISSTFDLLSAFPKDMPSKQGFDILAAHESPGTLAPVQVVINTEGKSVNLSALGKLPFVSHASSPNVSKHDSKYEEVTLTLNTNPYSEKAVAAIPKIHDAAATALASAGVANASSHVYVGGETAVQYDTEHYTYRDTHVIVPVVIGLIALLLLLYLRSVVAMLYLIGTVLLSFFSALGLGWIVLHDFMGMSAMEGAIPLYAFVFLVALGEDYNIFMVSRIWQERKSKPLSDAIAAGFAKTSGVITSAGLILAGTFAVLSRLPIQILVQFGIVTALGVLIDTFIVRPFLVPAITAILGRRAFWPARGEWAEPNDPTA